MTVFRWNSLQDLFAIQEKVNRLFEETIHRTEFPDDGLDAALWSPAADVYETPEEIVLNIELPGVRLEDVRLEALDGKLRVSGQRKADTAPSPGSSCAWSASTAASRATSRCRLRSTRARSRRRLRAGVLRVVAPEGREGPADPGRAAEGAVKSGPGVAAGVFRIGVIAEKYGIHPQTLRMYEREGLLRPGPHRGQHPPLRHRHDRAARDHPHADPAPRASTSPASRSSST